MVKEEEICDMPHIRLASQIRSKASKACRKIGLPLDRETSALVQEEAGIHVGISADLPEAAHVSYLTLNRPPFKRRFLFHEHESPERFLICIGRQALSVRVDVLNEDLSPIAEAPS